MVGGETRFDAKSISTLLIRNNIYHMRIYLYPTHIYIYIYAMYIICIIIVSVLFFLLPWHGHRDFWCFTLDSFQGECTIVVEVCQGQLRGEMVAVVFFFFFWVESVGTPKRCVETNDKVKQHLEDIIFLHSAYTGRTKVMLVDTMPVGFCST